MRRSVPIFVVAGVLLCCVLASGCTDTSTTNATTPGITSPTGGGTATLAVAAGNMAFDTTTITVPAGSNVTITFTNNDAGIPHNIAVYTDPSATSAIFRGPITTGPETATYSFVAPSAPGTYFFRCDPHPTTMTGQFIVE